MSKTQFSVLKIFELVFTVSMGERGVGWIWEMSEFVQSQFLNKLLLQNLQPGLQLLPRPHRDLWHIQSKVLKCQFTSKLHLSMPCSKRIRDQIENVQIN